MFPRRVVFLITLSYPPLYNYTVHMQKFSFKRLGVMLRAAFSYYIHRPPKKASKSSDGAVSISNEANVECFFTLLSLATAEAHRPLHPSSAWVLSPSRAGEPFIRLGSQEVRCLPTRSQQSPQGPDLRRSVALSGRAFGPGFSGP